MEHPVTRVPRTDSDLKGPSTSTLEEEFPARNPRVVHSLPGRVRVHFPHWREPGRQQIQEQLHRLPGVLKVKASAATRNVLFLYDQQQVSEQGLLEQLRQLCAPPENPARPPRNSPAKKSNRQRPLAVVEGKGKHRRARISVHGIHRDSGLSKRLVDKLEKDFQVKVRPHVLTGRIVVEYDHTLVQLEELLTTVAELEMPPLDDEDQPRHPLSSGPCGRARCGCSARCSGWE